jgi:hypothetical protein
MRAYYPGSFFLNDGSSTYEFKGSTLSDRRKLHARPKEKYDDVNGGSAAFKTMP